MTEQQTDLQERELDYWMARAYEAEGKLWKAEARIKAVEDVLDTYGYKGAFTGKEQCRTDLIRRALDGA